MNKNIPLKIVPIILILFLFSACTSNSQGGREEKELQTKVDTEEVDAQSHSNDDGIDEKEFQEDLNQFPEKKPERIIVTSVPVAEMLQLLDIEPIGVPTSTNPLPEEFSEIERIGSPMQPNLEVVANLEPDLIIGAKAVEDSLEASLEGVDLDRVYLKTDSLDDLKRTFKVLGTYFDKTDEMSPILEDIVQMENSLMKQAEGKERSSVLPIIGASDSFMVMNENSYLGSLIEKLGAENIATTVLDAKDTYSPISMEDIVVADPDIIFVLASGDHGASEEMFNQEVESNEIWKSLSAYQEDKVYMLDHEVFGVTSIHNVEEALTKISNYFY